MILRQLIASLESVSSAVRCRQQSLPSILEELSHQPLIGEYYDRTLSRLCAGWALQESWQFGFCEASEPERTILIGACPLGDEIQLIHTMTHGAEELRKLLSQCLANRQNTLRLTSALSLSAAGLLLILLL